MLYIIMNFTDGSTTALVYLDEKKIFLNGVFHTIDKINVNTKDYSRFEFSDYKAKIYNNILSLTVISTGTLKTLNLVITVEINVDEDTWTTYNIYADNYISLNTNGKEIKIGDEVFKVKSKAIDGIHTVYVTDKGKLSISAKPSLRPSLWNGIGLAISTNLKK